MPRKDRAFGHHFTTRQRGGNTSRRTRTPKNTYATKQLRHSPLVLDMSRKNASGTVKQAPKPPKGGSKPVGTPRGK